MMRKREYFKPLNDHGDVMRVSFSTERGELLRYVVLFEVYIEDEYYVAVRYDSAHGHPHRDLLDWEGRVADKEWLSPVPDDRAMTQAIKDLQDNWPAFREAFLRRKP